MAGRPRKYTQLLADIQALRAAGNTVREIAFKLDVPKSTVHRMLGRVA